MTVRLLPVADGATHANFEEIERAWPAEPTYRYGGDPNGNVTAGPGALCIDMTTGRLWVHEDTVESSANWMVK